MAPRTPLLHPAEYFETHGFELRPALIAVGTAILATVLAMVGFGLFLQYRLGAAGYDTPSGEVMSIVLAQVFLIVVMMAIGWIIVAFLLYGLGRVSLSHDAIIGETLVIAGWGMAPTVLTSIVAFAAVSVALADVSLQNPSAFQAEFEAAISATRVLPYAISFVVAGWQTYLYGDGLMKAFDVVSGQTYLIGGIIAYGGWLLSLA